jgi:hypothetical protein
MIHKTYRLEKGCLGLPDDQKAANGVRVTGGLAATTKVAELSISSSLVGTVGWSD